MHTHNARCYKMSKHLDIKKQKLNKNKMPPSINKLQAIKIGIRCSQVCKELYKKFNTGRWVLRVLSKDGQTHMRLLSGKAPVHF